MFEIIKDKAPIKDGGMPSVQATLQLMTVFAEVFAKAFTTQQLELLRSYIAHVNDGDDMETYRCVVAIFRRTLPHMKNIEESFLASIRKDLMRQLPRLQCVR
jgi:hypothetical protein